MHIRTLVSGMVLSSALAFAPPAVAQTASVDTAAIASACATSADTCLVAVQIAIATLQAAGLPPATVNAALGVIAATAVSAADALPPAQQAALAPVVTAIAQASSDPVQQAALTTLSANLQSGANVDLVAESSALSAS